MIRNKEQRNHKSVAIIISVIICCVLSHTFIPHHYINSKICFSIETCDGEKGNTSTDGHIPLSDQDNECSLTKVVVHESEQNKPIRPILSLIIYAAHLHTNRKCCCMMPEEIQLLNYNKYRPYYSNHYIDCVIPTLSMRAPPVKLL